MPPTRLLQVALLALAALALPAWGAPPPAAQGLARRAPAPPLRPEQVPQPLKEWTGWALRGQEAALCPLLASGGRAAEDDADGDGEDRCLWPGRLELRLDGEGGKFLLAATLYGEAFVPLPGDAARWPQAVTADGRAAPAIERDGRPALLLEKGEHTIAGAFAWRELPQSLPIPRRIGLVALSVRGKRAALPDRDADGLLWLQREERVSAGESRVELRVNRLVRDGVPVLLETRASLSVSGPEREVVLGRALLPGFVPLSLSSDLPARVEPDGRLRVQLRPGTWTIALTARSLAPVAELALPTPQPGAWAREEVWAFRAAPDVRVVDADGVPKVDASQTTLPAEWQKDSAFRVRPGERLRLIERRRGDGDPVPDQLTLERTLWLDFDGGGATVKDRISGKLTRSFRLDARAPLRLGRASIAGKDQLITRGSEGEGVEVRSGTVEMEGEGRIEGRGRQLPANGWAHPFYRVSAVLELPPGWRLVHAGGVDDAQTTWISHWSLLDLFVVLMTALACGKLFGLRWGALAFAAQVLAVPEGAPAWTWLLVLAVAAVLRVVPEGQARTALRALRGGALIVLVLFLVPFAVHHLRGAIYPALEGPTLASPRPVRASLHDEERSRAPAAPAQLMKKAPLLSSSEAYQGSRSEALTQIDPGALVQSGPGLPAWSWSQVRLTWNGPVEPGAAISLWLLPPWANLALAFVRIALLTLFLLRLISSAGGGLFTPLEVFPRKLAAPLAVLAALLASPSRAAEGFPPPELLQELRAGLTAPPACAPECASSARLLVDADGDVLHLRQEVSAAARVGIPLPGGLGHWSPERVLVDGRPAAALHRDAAGDLWIALDRGVHQIALEGHLPRGELAQIALPLRPRRVQARARGWTVSGLHEDGTVEADLQLTRVQTSTRREKLQPGQLPPFLEVERRLELGLTWTVETRVSRRSPEGTPIVVEIPLLPGESVTSAEVREGRGRALVTLGPRAAAATFRSTLLETAQVELVAPPQAGWTETWRVEVSPVWHVEPRGIPPVHEEAAALRAPLFRPWPGERLRLDVTRPEPVPGRTLTVRASTLTQRPGARTSDVRLELRVASSQGQPHAIALPEGSAVQSVQLDGTSLPPQQEGGNLILPLPPGEHTVTLDWREPRGARFLTRVSRPDLGAPSVNASARLELGPRWVLLVGGPRLGPAVLYWSFLLVMILLGLGLSRLDLAPLRAHQWVLLALGLSQVHALAAALVMGWLLALGIRRRHGAQLAPLRFSLAQIALVLWTLASAAVLFLAIQRGLLGEPEMQVAGNGSTASSLAWFADRAPGRLPSAFAVSAPLWIYRTAMLGWALWLASSLLRWLPWAWAGFSAGGLWRNPPAGTAT